MESVFNLNDNYDGIELEELEVKSRKTSQAEGTKYINVSATRSVISYLNEFFALSKTKLLRRCYYFSFLFGLLTFVLYGQSGSTNSYGINNPDWYLFFLAIMLVDMICATLDNFIAFSVDKFWFSYTENAIVVNTNRFEGSIGHIATVIIINAKLS